MREHWTLDPKITFLNHGSFGACPRAVLAAQAAMRAEMEREPVHFMMRLLEPRLDAARAAVAGFVGADPEDMVFVRNATAGVAAVLGSLALEPGDELLATDHGYNACKNALDRAAARAGARVVVARLPFPLTGPEEVTAAVTAAVSERTRLLLIDHVTSPTGLVLPVEAICAAMAARGVDVLVDGAHAPGMLALDLPRIGAAYYTGNLHKWACAPKGAALLWARRDRQARLLPAVISHGYNSTRPRPRMHELFDWTGTEDPTPWLCAPIALEAVAAMAPGGWPEVRARTRALLVTGRDLLAAALGIRAPAPDSMLGNLAALPLPPGPPGPRSALELAPLQEALFELEQIEVPVVPWPAPPRRLIRISSFLYNEVGEYERLASALRVRLAEEAGL